MQDLRYGWRLLLKRPAFTLMAVLSIAIGIGANAAIFGFADALLFRPISAHEPDRLVRLHATWPDGTSYHSFSYPTLRDLRETTAAALSGIASEYTEFGFLGRGEDSQPVVTAVVSANYFDVLGLSPRAGRFFLPDEETTPGGHPLVVLGSQVWERRFGADPTIVGRDVQINNHAYRVVGIAPEAFRGSSSLLRVDAFVPLMMIAQINPGSTVLEKRGARGLELLGRLAPGVEPRQAQTVVAAAYARLVNDHPDVYEGQGVEVASADTLPGEMRGAIGAFMALLMVLVGLILTIACANVATMLLARATGRTREIAVRLVNGASRGRLIRQLVTETLLLFACGGIAGVWLALAASRGLASFRMPMDIPVDLDLAIDGRVLAFTAGLTLLTGLISGLVPALQASRSDLAAALKREDPRSGGGSGRVRAGLVVTEVALSFLLVVVAGLFLQALRHAAELDPGFEHQGVVVANLDLTTQGYGFEQSRNTQQEFLDRVQALPGVESAALADMIPLALSNQVDIVNVAGFDPPEGLDGFVADTMMVSPEYFETLKMPLVSGRGFGLQDSRDAAPVAIVNETMARRFWGERDAVGRRFEVASAGTEVEVVGIVADAKYRTLGEEPRLYFYRPFQQAYTRDAMMIHVRSSLDTASTVSSVRGALRGIDPNASLMGVGPMSSFVSLSLLPQRLAGWIAASLGLVGLLLASVGLYGVTAYVVGQQTRELGIRMAMGATSREILLGVLRRGAALGGVGIVVGNALAFVSTRAVSGFLYGASAVDPVVFASATILFLGVAAFASLAPARRASRTDPIEALRYE